MELSPIFHRARKIAKLAAEVRVGRSSNTARRGLDHFIKLGLTELDEIHETSSIDEADHVEREVLAFLRATTLKVINDRRDLGGYGRVSGTLQIIYIAWRPKHKARLDR